MTNCIFCKIAKKELPANFVYEDEEIVSFPDINPRTSVHLLIIPKTHVEDLLSPEMQDGKIWGKMTTVAKRLVKENNLSGYRLVLNGGEAKLINHVHLHVMGNITAERKL